MLRELNDALKTLSIQSSSNTLVLYPTDLTLNIPGNVTQCTVPLQELFKAEAGCSYNLVVFGCVDSPLEITPDMCLTEGATTLYKALLETAYKYVPIGGYVVSMELTEGVKVHRKGYVNLPTIPMVSGSAQPVEFKLKHWKIEMKDSLNPVRFEGRNPTAHRAGKKLVVKWGNRIELTQWAFELVNKHHDWNLVSRLLNERLTVENLIQGVDMPIPGLLLEEALGRFVGRQKSQRSRNTLQLPTRSNPASEYYSLGPGDVVAGEGISYTTKFVQHDHVGTSPPRVHLDVSQ